MEVSGQLHALTVLPQGKQPRRLLGRRLGGPQRRAGRYGGEKNVATARNRNPAIQPRPRRYTDRDIL
jgi:hypothetical protein